MNTLSYRTISINKEAVRKEWILIDAKDQVLGRLASHVAMILRGKNKPLFTPHVDCGDHVIIVNAELVKLTGNKLDDKIYVRHSGYPGGQRQRTAREQLVKKPVAVVEHAVKGMLPRNRLGRAIFKNMHVYTGPDHPHEAQKPKALDIQTIR